MPCKAVLHAPKSVEVPTTARDTGQAFFKFPEPPQATSSVVPADLQNLPNSRFKVACDPSSSSRPTLSNYARLSQACSYFSDSLRDPPELLPSGPGRKRRKYITVRRGSEASAGAGAGARLRSGFGSGALRLGLPWAQLGL
eukprot:6190254-Pleurochrysis_carterae.AAC.1